MPDTTRSGPSSIPPAEYYEAGPEFDVGSWSPGQVHENLPATQVHLRFGTPPGVCFVVRFKGTDSLDALIDALVEHREHTFGKRGPLRAKVFVVLRKFGDGTGRVYGTFSTLERARIFCDARFEEGGIWSTEAVAGRVVHQRGQYDFIEEFEVDGVTR